MANRYWQATALEDVRFDRREQLATLALGVSVQELQALWPTLQSHQLDIRYNPGDSPSDIAAYREVRMPFSDAQ